MAQRFRVFKMTDEFAKLFMESQNAKIAGDSFIYLLCRGESTPLK